MVGPGIHRLEMERKGGVLGTAGGSETLGRLWLAEATCISGCLVTTMCHYSGAVQRQDSPVGSAPAFTGLTELAHEITTNFIQDSKL